MRRETIRSLLVGLALVALAGPAAADQQSEYQRKVEEYNAYQDVLQTQEPNQRLQAIENFLQTYPDSTYLSFVYQNYAETALLAQKFPKAMEAVDRFLALDRAQVLKAYRDLDPNLQDAALDPLYYRMMVIYTLSFPQGFREPNGDAVARKAAERAQKGLEMHERLYANVQPPQGMTTEQFNQIKEQEKRGFYAVAAFTAYRAKDFAAAGKHYDALVGYAPGDPTLSYRLGLSNLQKDPRDWRKGFWYVARAIALNVPKSEEVRDYLTKSLAAYQQVPPDCLADQVNRLVARAGTTAKLPADWQLLGAEQVNALRAEMTVKRIFDDLKVGGDTAQQMFLASCGTVIGLGEAGQPELPVLILEVHDAGDNLVTLRAAAGQEAVDAKQANVEVKVVGPAEAKNLKVGDVVGISGKIVGYVSEPAFVLKLAEGMVNAEDIPRTRGRGGSAR
ncbi:MAG: hypothetical protein HYY26_04915 [Acidobacteria bacterium]|nr:hypothetical protein [Acidobacteriota bacterium]